VVVEETATLANERSVMNLRIVLFMALTVSPAFGQTPGWIQSPPVDRVAVPMDQAADVIVVLIPDESDDGVCGAPHDCVVRGSVVRLDKGPMPEQIVRTANSFGNPLKAGEPITLYLSKFKDRDAYYLIGAIPMPAGN
jgi:hypothetical protein